MTCEHCGARAAVIGMRGTTEWGVPVERRVRGPLRRTALGERTLGEYGLCRGCARLYGVAVSS